MISKQNTIINDHYTTNYLLVISVTVVTSTFFKLNVILIMINNNKY